MTNKHMKHKPYYKNKQKAEREECKCKCDMFYLFIHVLFPLPKHNQKVKKI